MRESTKPMLNTFISVGVEADLSDVPENLAFITDEPLLCGGIPVSVISINNYAGYKGYAPEGCTAMTSVIMGDSFDFGNPVRKTAHMKPRKKRWQKHLPTY